MNNGIRDSPCRVFYSNGQLKYEGICIDGVRGGYSKGYYPSGQAWWVGTLVYGCPCGKDGEFYDPSGLKLTDLTPYEKIQQIEAWQETNASDRR